MSAVAYVQIGEQKCLSVSVDGAFVDKIVKANKVQTESADLDQQQIAITSLTSRIAALQQAVALLQQEIADL